MRARATAAALLLAVACTAGAGPALAAATPKATDVSYAKLRADVAAGRGTVAEINRVAHSVELVMTDRKREKAVYPSHDEKQLSRYLKDHHVPVVIRHHHHGTHKASGGHPLRYAALALALIAIALAVLLLARRRRPRAAAPRDQ